MYRSSSNVPMLKDKLWRPDIISGAQFEAYHVTDYWLIVHCQIECASLTGEKHFVLFFPPRHKAWCWCLVQIVPVHEQRTDISLFYVSPGVKQNPLLFTCDPDFRFPQSKPCFSLLFVDGTTSAILCHTSVFSLPVGMQWGQVPSRPLCWTAAVLWFSAIYQCSARLAPWTRAACAHAHSGCAPITAACESWWPQWESHTEPHTVPQTQLCSPVRSRMKDELPISLVIWRGGGNSAFLAFSIAALNRYYLHWL